MLRCALNGDQLHGLNGHVGTEAVVSGYGSQIVSFGEVFGLQLGLSTETWPHQCLSTFSMAIAVGSFLSPL